MKINITFPRDGRLSIWLVSPAGSGVQLTYRHGGRDANFNDTVFDDEADTPIAQGDAPFAGSFQPDEPLVVFDGQSSLGTWTLFIQNVSTMNTNGTLNAWSLEIAGDNQGGGDGGGGTTKTILRRRKTTRSLQFKTRRSRSNPAPCSPTTPIPTAIR